MKDISAKEKEIADLMKAQEAARKRAAMFKNLLNKFKSMIDSGKLAVEIRKGKMIVKMSDKILFDPGKDKIKKEGEAARKGFTLDEYATKTAERWREGLAEWGQEGSRIAKLRQSTDIAIYTPGSNTGLPLSVLRSFDAPAEELTRDADGFRDRVLTSVSGLLALLGVEADPIRSREHILLANVLQQAWGEGRNLDMEALIWEIQSPPFKKVGVFDLESFFPSKERFALAMSLNNLLASPGFSAWMEGVPLDIGGLLYTTEGKPRIAILSIAHLSEAERMFFVT